MGGASRPPTPPPGGAAKGCAASLQGRDKGTRRQTGAPRPRPAGRTAPPPTFVRRAPPPLLRERCASFASPRRSGTNRKIPNMSWRTNPGGWDGGGNRRGCPYLCAAWPVHASSSGMPLRGSIGTSHPKNAKNVKARVCLTSLYEPRFCPGNLLRIASADDV